MQSYRIRPRRLVSALLSLLGMACLAIAASLPFLLKDPVLGFVLMGLPMLFSGVVVLQHALSLGCSELTLDADGLRARLPRWRGFPAPPCRRSDVRWERITAIHHRREDYWLWVGAKRPYVPLLPVDAYLLEYDGGSLLIAGNMLPRPAALLAAIAERRGLVVREQPPVAVGAVAALLGSLPPWR